MKKFQPALRCAVILGILGMSACTPKPEEAPSSNLAIGAKVVFLPVPPGKSGEKLTSVANALTDGEFSQAKGNDIWRDPAVPVWKYAGRVNLAVDLGRPCEIDEIGIRLLGGSAPDGGQAKSFPVEVEALVSDDGEHYRKVAFFSRWEPGDFEKYGVPGEEGTSWVHHLRFKDLKVSGRWVGFRIYTTGMTASDEVSIYGREMAKGAVPDSAGTPDGFSVREAQAYFHKPYLQIATNLPLPVPVGTRIPPEADGKPLAFEVELPKGVELRGGHFGPVEVRDAAQEPLADGGKRYRFTVEPGKLSAANDSQKNFGRLYLQASGWKEGTSGKLAYRFASGPSWQSPVMTLPLHAVKVEPAPRLKKMMAALGWWRLSETTGWPDALATLEAIGMNTVSDTMPGPVPAFPKPQEMELLQAARARGLLVSVVEMPIHRMLNAHRQERELYCQYEDGGVGTAFCPSYRGKYWKEEVSRFSGIISHIRPHFTSQDIELWKAADRLDFDFGSEVQERRKCTRCEEDFRQSKLKSTAAWRKAKGLELWSELISAAREKVREVNGPEFRVSGYNFRPGQTYHKVWSFDLLKKKGLLDHSQVANYSPLYPPHLESIGDRIRHDRKKSPGIKVMPWLTPGDAGPFPGELFQWSMLEAYTNGADGIWFYSNRVWDSESLIAFNRVVRAIAPVEEIIMEGRLVGDSALVQGAGRVSGMMHGGEMVLLVADYRSTTENGVAVQLKLPKPSRLVDLMSGKEINPALPAGTHQLTIPLEGRAARLIGVTPTGG